MTDDTATTSDPAATDAAASAARDAAAARDVIRPLAPGDRQAVRDICVATAYRNRGAAYLFEDAEVHADYWTSYYTDHRPEDSQVIDRDGRVIGYFLGCSDQAHFQRVMTRRIVPWCALRAGWRALTGRYRNPVSRRYVAHMLLRAPAETPDFPYLDYPAHYHCNMLPEAYGQRYLTTMLLAFLDRLEAKGVTRLHGSATEPAGRDPWARLARTLGVPQAERTATKPTTLYARVLGDDRPMTNRSWGGTVANWRLYALALRERMRL
jgi:hypothetical protein